MRWFLLILLLAAGCDGGDTPEAVWLTTGRAPGQVIYPRAIDHDPTTGGWWVVDRVAHVQYLDPDGQVVIDWEMPEWDAGKPTGLSVGPDGNLWVADTHYSRVIVYSPAGEELFRFGEYGEGPGQFLLPTDVAFHDGEDSLEIYVAEYGGNDRIQVFDRDLNHLRTIGSFGNGPDQFRRPQSMVIQDGELFVADSVNHRVVVLDLDGNPLRVLGGAGVINLPYGLARMPTGELLLTETGNNRLTLMDPLTGELLEHWGTFGRTPGGLVYPWAADVDADGRVVVVDSGNNRLQVVRF